MIDVGQELPVRGRGLRRGQTDNQASGAEGLTHAVEEAIPLGLSALLLELKELSEELALALCELGRCPDHELNELVATPRPFTSGMPF